MVTPQRVWGHPLERDSEERSRASLWNALRPFRTARAAQVRFETRDADGTSTRHAYALRLPVAATCFASPDGYNARDVKAFRHRWDDVGAADGCEQQIVVSSRSPVDDRMLNDLRTRVVADALKGAPVKGADVSPFTITAASVVHATEGAVDVLLRLEANAAARAFRITVRSPSPDAAAAFKNVLQALLTSYYIM